MSQNAENGVSKLQIQKFPGSMPQNPLDVSNDEGFPRLYIQTVLLLLYKLKFVMLCVSAFWLYNFAHKEFFVTVYMYCTGTYLLLYGRLLIFTSSGGGGTAQPKQEERREEQNAAQNPHRNTRLMGNTVEPMMTTTNHNPRLMAFSVT